jgi:opacity protein-like surface antigen
MRAQTLRPFVLGLGLALALPAWVDAQSRSARRASRSPVPDQGMVAVGGSAGVFVPSDDFNSSPFIEGFGEYYLTPRVSLRGRVAFTDPSFETEDSDSLRHLQLGFDAIYNWEHGKWHPFAGGGIGANVLQPKDNGEAFGDSKTKPSVNAIGGVEYFLNRRVSLKAEGRLQFLNDVFGRDPSGLALSFGVKRYF